MRKYTVSLDYKANIVIEVEADDEGKAIQLATETADNSYNEDFAIRDQISASVISVD